MKVSIEAMRVHRGLTQDSACEKLGITRQTLSNWEKGKTTPKTEQILGILRVYNCSLDDIILPKKSAKS